MIYEGPRNITFGRLCFGVLFLNECFGVPFLLSTTSWNKTCAIRQQYLLSFVFERYSIEGINPGNWPVPFLKCYFRNCKRSDEQTEKPN